MKKSILIPLMFIILEGFSISPDQHHRILYIFPDDVEIAINDYIERYSHQEDVKFILTLYKEANKTYKVYINPIAINKESDGLYWEQVTNRFAVINNMEYPLLFDYDYDFSTKKPSEIGEYGKRDGQVLRIMSINDGFYVKFSKLGLCD